MKQKVNKSVCVVILNYQTYTDTINYVNSLKDQKGIELHILIVDNCSPNNSYDHLSNYFDSDTDVEVIKSARNGGYAYGNNYGLRHIEKRGFEYIVISNNDIEISDQYLMKKLIEEYSHFENVAFIAPLMRTKGKVSKFSAWKLPSFIDDCIQSLRLTNYLFGRKLQYDFKLFSDQPQKVDCLSGAFFLGKYEIFTRVNFFDEGTFLYGEEIILALRLKSIGLSNFIIPKLDYHHQNSKTISSLLTIYRTHKHLTDSRLYYHSKYFGASFVKLYFLKFLHYFWCMETFLYSLICKMILKK